MATLGSLVYRVNKQREALQWVRDQHGTAFYDFEWDSEKGWILRAELPGPDWLRELIGIDYFADVALVAFYDNTEVSLAHDKPVPPSGLALRATGLL